jgi:hypothetical protein
MGAQLFEITQIINKLTDEIATPLNNVVVITQIRICQLTQM